MFFQGKERRCSPGWEKIDMFFRVPSNPAALYTFSPQIYYHGEPISVNVHVTNNTNKTVKKIKISVRQYADICLFNTAQYKCPVAVEDADDMVAPSSTFCKVYTLTPFLANNREKRGLALDGKLKHEDTNLASTNKEILGIIVSYKVKVKLVLEISLGLSPWDGAFL
uniref:Arrestin beta 1 n=1 Tax=Pavo cristatus TaxID=9049 RepID=A0A8C9FM56_PAVCR